MASFDDVPTVATPVVPDFRLTPPAVITPIPAEATRSAVPLKPEAVKALDGQVERFIETLLNEDLHSAAFKSGLDRAMALGRDEISSAASVMQSRFPQSKAVVAEDDAVGKAIGDLRGQLDKLNPRHQSDLLAPSKILGVIPFGNKLGACLRKVESAGPQLHKSMGQLHAVRDGVQRRIVDTEAARTELWAAMQQLAAAAHFATTLDARLADRVSVLQITDPQRSQTLQHELLFRARQNLSDILSQQAVCVNGYLALDVLKKTGREMMNGCNRVASALGNLVSETQRALDTQVDKIQELFDQTEKAMDAMGSFRAQARDVMAQNDAIMKEQLARSELLVERLRRQ